MNLQMRDRVEVNGKKGAIAARSGLTGEVLVAFDPPREFPGAILVSNWLNESQVTFISREVPAEAVAVTPEVEV